LSKTKINYEQDFVKPISMQNPTKLSSKCDHVDWIKLSLIDVQLCVEK